MKKNLSLIILVIVVVVALIVFAYFLVMNKTNKVEPTVETANQVETNIDVENKIEDMNNEIASSNSEENAQDKTEYTDKNGDTAIIPKDFRVSSKEDEQTINNGLVVIRTRWK